MKAFIPAVESLADILCCPECGEGIPMTGSLRCPGCDTVFVRHLDIPVLQPRPQQVLERFGSMRNPLQTGGRPAPVVAASFANAAYRLFVKAPFWPHAAANAYGRKALRRMLATVHGVALEVGCGEHSAAPYIAREDVRYIPTDYIGWDEVVDIDTEWNGGLLVHSRTRRPLFWADSTNLPFRSASLDAWIAIETLEHLPSPDCALAEASRCLKHGGRAYISVPWLLRVHGGKDDEGDYGRYTRLKIELMARQCGMELIDFYVNTSMWR